MKEIDNLYLKELVDELPGTVLRSGESRQHNEVLFFKLAKVEPAGGRSGLWKNWRNVKFLANPMHVALHAQDLIKDAQGKSKSPAVILSAVSGINWAGHVA